MSHTEVVGLMETWHNIGYKNMIINVISLIPFECFIFTEDVKIFK